jgi:tellurite methyltransferase
MPDTGEAVPVGVKDWEKKFAEKPDDWFFGREPSEMARLTLSYWRMLHGDRTGRAIDHGCGEGRDAVFLAEKGFDVTAVDGASSALDKARRLADEKGVRLAELVRTDLRSYECPVPYDLVLSHNSIQFLGSDCLRELEKLQEMTAPGGVASVAAFTREAEALAGKPDLYRFDRNELKFRFEGWRLLYYGEFLLWREPTQNFLSFANVIAQKPE